jgi:hypothetical protein
VCHAIQSNICKVFHVAHEAAKGVGASLLAIVLLGAAFINVRTGPVSSDCITTETEAGETAGSVGTFL